MKKKIKKLDFFKEADKLAIKKGYNFDWAFLQVVENKINEIIDYLNVKDLERHRI